MERLFLLPLTFSLVQNLKKTIQPFSVNKTLLKSIIQPHACWTFLKFSPLKFSCTSWLAGSDHLLTHNNHSNCSISLFFLGGVGGEHISLFDNKVFLTYEQMLITVIRNMSVFLILRKLCSRFLIFKLFILSFSRLYKLFACF